MKSLTARRLRAVAIPSRHASRPTLWLFDYDGTLAPLASHPSVVHFPKAARLLLERLLRRPGSVVGLISGRERRDLEAQVRLPGLIYAGNHGWEIRGPGLRFDHPSRRRWRPVLRKLARALRRAFHGMNGVWVEDKGFTLSVHYRLARPALVPRVKKILAEVIAEKSFRGMTVVHGKKIFDLRPDVRWNKGRALAWIRKRLKRDPFVFYSGDDATDEDAFSALHPTDVGVRVGVGASRAGYFSKTPEDMVRVLHRFLDNEERYG